MSRFKRVISLFTEILQWRTIINFRGKHFLSMRVGESDFPMQNPDDLAVDLVLAVATFLHLHHVHWLACLLLLPLFFTASSSATTNHCMLECVYVYMSRTNYFRRRTFIPIESSTTSTSTSSTASASTSTSASSTTPITHDRWK